MSGYLRPVGDVYVPSSWQDHRDRNPPSQEPGTDYAVDVGTPVLAAGAGRISDRKTSNSYATGRYLTIALDDGRTVRYLHLNSVARNIGDRVSRGDVVGYSGASGNGSDYYYGPHVHTTLWPGPEWAAPTIDFEQYAGEEPTEPEPPEEDEDMSKMRGATYPRAADGATVRLLFNEDSGWYHEFLADSGSYVNPIAEHWETNSWPTITEAHAKVLKTSLDKVQREDVPTIPPKSSESTTVSGPAWVVGGFLGLIGLVELLRFIFDFIVRAS